MNELMLWPQNCESARDMKFPSDAPTLFFLSNESSKLLPEWYDLHLAVIGDKSKSEIITLAGSHYLHYEYSGEIAETFKQWYDSVHDIHSKYRNTNSS
jgi:hypothetical protein